MNIKTTIWKYQAILMLRNKQLLAGCVILLCAGLYGLSYGRYFVEQQRQVIYSIDTAQTGNAARALADIQRRDADTSADKNKVYRPMVSDLLTKKKAIYRPSQFAALAVGQKDTYPYYHNVDINNSIHAYVVQEMHNPHKLMAGNFDLTFVFIYLFPLFIIALGYNALSGEKDQHTFTLLSIQIPVMKVVRQKLLFQFLLVSLLAQLLNGIGWWWNGISLIESRTAVLNWILITEIYFLFWFSMIYLVICFNWSSAINTLVLGGAWILFLLLIPSSINNISTPPDEKELVKSVFERGRETDVHHDLSKRELIDSFYRLQHPPTIKMDTTNKSNLVWLVAVSELINRESNDYASAVIRRRKKEFEEVVGYNYINPVFTAQYAYNQVAHTELNHYYNYLLAAEAYQAERRYYVYDFLLNGKEYRAADYLRFPENKFKQPEAGTAGMLLLLSPVWGLSLLGIGGGLWLTRRKKR